MNTNIPIQIPVLNLAVPLDELAQSIEERMKLEVESKWDQISEQIRDRVNLVVTRVLDGNLERIVVEEINKVVTYEIEQAISRDKIQKAAKDALKAATAEAVSKILGH